MAIKTVRVEGKQGSRFKMDITAGNHTLVVDQSTPQGEDLGPNPLEYCLVALAGCIGAIGRIIASQRQMDVRGFGIVVEGELDTDNLLGTPTEKRTGFSRIDVYVDVDADMTADEKQAFLHEIDGRCPISDCLLNGTEVKIRTF